MLKACGDPCFVFARHSSGLLLRFAHRNDFIEKKNLNKTRHCEPGILVIKTQIMNDDAMM